MSVIRFNFTAYLMFTLSLTLFNTCSDTKFEQSHIANYKHLLGLQGEERVMFNSCSPVYQIDSMEESSTGNTPLSVKSALTIQLSSSEPIEFFTENTCTVPVTEVVIAAGQTNVPFYVKTPVDSRESMVITAQASNYVKAEKTIAVDITPPPKIISIADILKDQLKTFDLNAGEQFFMLSELMSLPVVTEGGFGTIQFAVNSTITDNPPIIKEKSIYWQPSYVKTDGTYVNQVGNYQFTIIAEDEKKRQDSVVINISVHPIKISISKAELSSNLTLSTKIELSDPLHPERTYKAENLYQDKELMVDQCRSFSPNISAITLNEKLSVQTLEKVSHEFGNLHTFNVTVPSFKVDSPLNPIVVWVYVHLTPTDSQSNPYIKSPAIFIPIALARYIGNTAQLPDYDAVAVKQDGMSNYYYCSGYFEDAIHPDVELQKLYCNHAKAYGITDAPGCQ